MITLVRDLLHQILPESAFNWIFSTFPNFAQASIFLLLILAGAVCLYLIIPVKLTHRSVKRLERKGLVHRTNRENIPKIMEHHPRSYYSIIRPSTGFYKNLNPRYEHVFFYSGWPCFITRWLNQAGIARKGKQTAIYFDFKNVQQGNLRFRRIDRVIYHRGEFRGTATKIDHDG